MKSHVEIEQILECLGNEWPAGSSLVDSVMRRIESQPVRLKLRRTRFHLAKSLFATAASLTVVFVLWWSIRGGSTLYAQAIDAIHRARSFHMTTTVQPDAHRPAQTVMESWYERGIGFRETVGPEVRLGNQRNFWSYRKDSKLAIRSKSHGIDDIVARIIDNDTFRMLKEEKTERYPTSDQTVDGQACKAYLLSGELQPTPNSKPASGGL